jgi:protein O-GlcNAc transferase
MMHIDKTIQSAFEQYRSGNLDEAEALCRNILARKSKHADALSLLGLIFYQRKDYDTSIDYLQKASQQNPANYYLHNNLGTAYKARKDFDSAITCYRKALQLNPDFADAHNNLGSVLQEKMDIDKAILCYQEALGLDAQNADAYFNLGTAFKVKGEMDKAMACYGKALEFNPKFFEAYNNIGVDYKERGQLKEALSYFMKVLELNPMFFEAYNNIGSILIDQGKLREAEMYFRRALQLKPDFSGCFSNLLLGMNYSSAYDARTVYLEHLNFGKRFAESLSQAIRPHTNERTSERHLRIGYVSPDFRRHSVDFFLEPVLASHDRERFDVFCYSDVLTPDEVTQHIRELPLTWRDIACMSDEQVEDVVRSDAVDILVDLAGHTADNRMLLFARKPAPIQISWIGYPNTTGLRTMDYRIVDERTDPSGIADPFYTEKLIRMPVSFLCYQPEKDCPDAAPSPSLETGNVTFGSFNTVSKIDIATVRLWSRILKKVTDSRLLLKAKSLFDEGTREYLGASFRGQGISGERLVFMHHTASHREHLGLYRKVDVALDTFPYNGTTTTCEALWMGVPVITLAGDRHASRVGTSLLTNVGLPELVAQTGDEYVDIAARLADDVERLQFLHRNLRQMMENSPLMRPAQFTADLEKCYRQMWQAWCNSH